MKFRQPIPRFRTPDDLKPVAGEHYEVARSFDGWFIKSDFLRRYRSRYPKRAVGSMMPPDYCFNSENKGNTKHPRFLLRDGSRYRFIGLDGQGDIGIAPRRHDEAPPPGVETILPIVAPPIPGASEFLERLGAVAGQPERNMEDLVKNLLLRLGHDAKHIVFQVGRIDVSVRDGNGQTYMVIEAKCSLASASARDDALRKGFDYAHRTDAQFVVVTDADRFEIYDLTRSGGYPAKCCGKFQLTEFHQSDVVVFDLLRPKCP